MAASAVSGVFEKHDLCPRQHRLVERQNKPLEPAAVFDRAAETGDVDGIRNVQRPAGKAAVNIWLDGVGQHQIRAKPLQDRAVLPQELCIARRVHAAPVDGRINKAAAKLHKLRNETAVRQRDIHLVSCTQKRCKQVLPKAIQANIVVGKHQNPLI